MGPKGSKRVTRRRQSIHPILLLYSDAQAAEQSELVNALQENSFSLQQPGFSSELPLVGGVTLQGRSLKSGVESLKEGTHRSCMLGWVFLRISFHCSSTFSTARASLSKRACDHGAGKAAGWADEATFLILIVFYVYIFPQGHRFPQGSPVNFENNLCGFQHCNKGPILLPPHTLGQHHLAYQSNSCRRLLPKGSLCVPPSPKIIFSFSGVTQNCSKDSLESQSSRGLQ